MCLSKLLRVLTRSSLLDGATGLHNHIKKNLPVAKLIMDYWHACQHIADCSETLHADDVNSSNQWRTNYCHVLREKGAKAMLEVRCALLSDHSLGKCYAKLCLKNVMHPTPAGGKKNS